MEETEFKYRGVSSGMVGDCGSCEHCYDLTKGTHWFDVGGCSWCLDCLNCNNDVYYDPVSDTIFDDVYSVKWNEYCVMLGDLGY
jgi:hypothetical protein